MEGKNIFGIALSCSVLWHLLSVQAVNIVWPDKLISHNFTAINFLGEILEKSEYTQADLNKLNSLQKNVKTEEKLIPNAKPEEILFNTERRQLKKESLPLSELSQKSVPEIVFDITDNKQFLVLEKIDDKNKRSVLFKPELPEYPDWAKEWGHYFEVELKFLILPDGTVANVEKNTSSGYPELDEIGVRYIRKWKFVPLLIDQTQAEQWGTIKLVFKLQ
ncbi:MAG: energy transducer TonB [Candidatus Omnitrophota bacterium]